MSLHRPLRLAPLRLALFAVLSAAAFGVSAQPIDPAASPAPTDPADAATDLPTVADAGEVDRRCLKYTGSRLTADASPQTDARATQGRRSVHERRKCAMATGTVYTREDLERTGQVDLVDALRTLDTRL